LILFSAAQLQQVAMLHASTGKAGFMTALYIVIVPLLGLFLGKKSTPLLWISVLLSVLGLYFLCIGIGGTFTLEAWDFMLIGCAFLFSIHILVIDHFNVKANCIKLSCIQFLVAGILNLPFLFLLDGPAFQLPPSLSNIFAAWLPVLYAGVLSSGVAYTLQIVGQKGMNPTVSSLILSLESVTAAVAGVIILKQSMSVSEALGCIIMFCAIILAQLPMPKKK
jgi:drug/metabolite transporter (DMT)-like permease